MNILLLTNCIAQPDDTDKSVNDIVFSFAKEWQRAGNNVVIINSESKFIYPFYKVPKFILRELKKRGNFTVPSIASRKELNWEKEGVKIARFPLFKAFPHASFLSKQYERQANKIKSYLQTLDFIPDIITGHWIEPQLKLVSILGSYYRAKTAIVIHGELQENLSNEYKNYFANLTTVFFRSKYVRDQMVKKYGTSFLRDERTRVCYSGIPDTFVYEQQKRTDWRKNGISFIYVGRLERYKRIDVVLQALARTFPDRDFTFEIVGDGPEHDALEEIVNNLGLSKNVHFVGRVPRTEVIQRLNKADCFVMPSENEVFGLVYLEAMACGCITIASKRGGVDGIIVDGNNGFLCEQGSIESLCAVIQRIELLSDEEKDNIRLSAYNTVEKYTDSGAAKDYLLAIIE